MLPIIRTENLWRIFELGNQKVEALKNINISIKRGSLTILMGRSGSGKTTLMNLMGTLDEPSEGSIYIGDHEITKLPEKERDNFRCSNIGFIFQSIALISMMTAYENVEFAMRIAGYDPNLRKKRSEECLEFVGLGKRMHHRPQELSGGEQQRVAIARAISHKPKIIFADEPTAELDTHTGLKIIRLFKDLVKEEGITILMTTHDPGMLELADHVLILEDGEIIDER